MLLLGNVLLFLPTTSSQILTFMYLHSFGSPWHYLQTRSCTVLPLGTSRELLTPLHVEGFIAN